LIGKEFQYPDGTGPWYYVQSAPSTTLATEAKIIFIGSCDMDVPVQHFLGFDYSSDSRRALVVPRSTVDVSLPMAEFAWLQIAQRLTQENSLAESVTLANADIDRKTWRVPVVHWKLTNPAAGQIRFY
jgi:hypothetical protein